MLIADKWEEYEVLDAGDGAKLERWGHGAESYILSRPDPQILWPKEKPELWSKADGVYTRDEAGKGTWNFSNPNRKPPEKWQIRYNSPTGELKFWIKPTDFKHTGIFPEQAVNWDWMIDLIKNSRREINILNLFAYTGGATIACAKSGAVVTHVDSAKGMVEWASDNAKSNSAEARWVVDDVMKFVTREEKRGVKYDAIIMDPPSYGRGKTGETWKIEKMLWPLIESSMKILSDKPLFFVINSYTTGLGTTVIKNMLESALHDRGGKITSDEISLPITGSDKLLPAGISGRWEAK
ncbi:MAG: class I SAM-dependent methyltransferase [bacterium]|nr:class I SAM-dependent methyltransferase [bacterium]